MDEPAFIALAKGKMRQALDQGMLDAIADSLNSKGSSYQAMLSGHIKQLFNSYDPEETGEIPAEKFPELITHVGCEMSAAEMKRVLHIVDTDGSGGINFTEFVDWWRDFALNQVFTKFDSDGSGELSPIELKELLQSLGIALPKKGDELNTVW